MACGASFLGVWGGLLVGGFCVLVGYGLFGLRVGGVLGWVSHIVWAFSGIVVIVYA